MVEDRVWGISVWTSEWKTKSPSITQQPEGQGIIQETLFSQKQRKESLAASAIERTKRGMWDFIGLVMKEVTDGIYYSNLGGTLRVLNVMWVDWGC